MSVLPDHEITKECHAGMVTPFVPGNVQPASIDLLLSPHFIEFDVEHQQTIDLLDVKDNYRIVEATDRYPLMPGAFVLASTVERVNIPVDIAARIEGKSSIGRLGLMVHVTAGYIDPGFRGPITLELRNLRQVPIVLRPGLPICQLSFHRMESHPLMAYNGRYQDASGVEASLYGKTRKE